MTTEDETQPPQSNLPDNSPWWAKWLAASWKDAWKWASVQFPVAVAFGAEIYAADPAGTQAFVKGIVPATWWPHLIAGGCFLQVALRMVKQNKPQPKA